MRLLPTQAFGLIHGGFSELKSHAKDVADQITSNPKSYPGLSQIITGNDLLGKKDLTFLAETHAKDAQSQGQFTQTDTAIANLMNTGNNWAGFDMYVVAPDKQALPASVDDAWNTPPEKRQYKIMTQDDYGDNTLLKPESRKLDLMR